MLPGDDRPALYTDAETPPMLAPAAGPIGTAPGAARERCRSDPPIGLESRWSEEVSGSPRRSSAAYSAMFSTFAAGAFLLVTGAAGCDVSRRRVFFEGVRWGDGPIWWQVAFGLVLLRIALYLLRRLEPGLTRRTPEVRTLKHVGSGTTAGAQRPPSPPARLSDGEPRG